MIRTVNIITILIGFLRWAMLLFLSFYHQGNLMSFVL